VKHPAAPFHVKLAAVLDRFAVPGFEPLAAVLELQAADPAASTTVRDPAEAVDRHVADSLVALELAVVRRAGRIADLGAGAGWPGLALAAALPAASVALVESASRHCRYLERAAAGLPNATVVHARAEEWRDGLGVHDLVTARALAALPVVLEYAAPLLAADGHVIAWKAAVAPEEAAAGSAAAEALGLQAVEVRHVEPYAGARDHTLHVFRKIAPTPPRFPRRPGMAVKRPLGDVGPGRGANPTAPAASVIEDMGTIYAIANQKGGVGKTTTAVNVAACIAAAGYETLLVDVDPQGNATVGLGMAREAGTGVYAVLAGEVDAGAAVRSTGVERLSLLASTPDLAGASMELPRLPGSETRLRDALLPLREDYAFILLDCPPSLGPLTVNALVAAERVIVPVQTEYFALEGLAGLLETLALIQRELNPRLTVAGMLLTMHDARTKLAQDVEREVREHFPALVFDTVIPRNVRLGEAPSYGLPVIHHDPHCAGSEAYFELAKEVAARG
jgi:chromosome partitioning protein